jgi:CHASE3 domain sensor protein
MVRQSRSIRGRMVRMLVVPLATMLGLLGYIVFTEVRTYRAAAEASETIRLALAVQDLVHELQRERGLTNGLLGGETRYRSDVDRQRERADTAFTGLASVVAGAGQRATPVGDALRALATWPAVRGAVDGGRANRGATFDFYTGAIDGLNSVNLGEDEIDDGTLRRGLAALRAVGNAKESSAKERGFLNGVFAAGRFSGDEYLRLADIRATKRAALADFERQATPAQHGLATAAMRSAAATKAAGYEKSAIEASDGRPLTVSARDWWDAMTAVVDELREVQQAVGLDAEARGAALRRGATAQLLVALAVGLLALLGEAFLLAASARSIARPLAGLVREADDVAGRRLPEAVARIQNTAGSRDGDPPPEEHPAAPSVRIPTGAGAEIRSVAEALDRVQRVAYDLATEQAVLRRNTTESLANLGRRNQNLLRRQLAFISQLEREEADPGALANLFELDHLATRMRRNAESLLVLVGEDTPRRWTAPMPIADVIRAAVGEVEDYRRVDLRRIDDGYLAGSVVAALAHMIAELAENGLAFSPPDLDVAIYGRWTGTRYLVAIVDQGVGMSDEDLSRANSRLRGEESFLLSPARFLGHHVVGQLARESGAAVQLAHSPVTGVTARIVLPPEVLVTAPAAGSATPLPAAVQRPEPLRRAAHLGTAVLEPVAVAFEPVASVREPVASVLEPVASAFEPVASAFEPVAAVPEPAGGRTRNGLVKRTPRNPSAAPAAVPPPSTAAEPHTEVVRAPHEVRTMLTAFRDGVRRGATQERGPR